MSKRPVLWVRPALAGTRGRGMPGFKAAWVAVRLAKAAARAWLAVRKKGGTRAPSRPMRARRGPSRAPVPLGPKCLADTMQAVEPQEARG